MAHSPIFFNKDNGVLLKFTMTKEDDTALNLTGGTVQLLAEGVSGSPFSCTITDAVNGKVERTVAANDFKTGTYRSQLKATIGGTIFHSDIFVINVSAALA